MDLLDDEFLLKDPGGGVVQVNFPECLVIQAQEELPTGFRHMPIIKIRRFPRGSIIFGRSIV